MRGKIDTVSTVGTNYIIAEDRYYTKKMKEILEAFPTKGPPFSAIQLAPHVYIGNQRNADDLPGLERLGITHVLNAAGTRKFDLTRSPYPKDSCIKSYLMIPAEDHDHYEIRAHFDDAIDFLKKCRKQGGKALVHCNMGINRSGAICAAYIMADEGRRLLETIQWLKQKRQFILCNKGFRKQLVKYARSKHLLDLVHRDDVEGANYKGTVRKVVPKEEGEKERSSRREVRSYRRSDSDTAIRPLTMARDDWRKSSETTSSVDEGEGSSRHRSYDYLSGSTSNSYSLPSSGFLTLPRGSKSDFRSSSSSSRDKNRKMEDLPENLTVDSFKATPSKKYGSKPRVWLSRSKSTTDASPDCEEEDEYNVPTSKSSPPSPFSGFRSLLSRNKSSSVSSLRQRDRRGTTTANEDCFVSTTRPLQIYKRSATDSELLQKPHSQQAYKRSETIATDNMGFEGLRLRDDNKEVARQLAARDRFGPATRSRASQSSRAPEIRDRYRHLEPRDNISTSNFSSSILSMFKTSSRSKTVRDVMPYKY